MNESGRPRFRIGHDAMHDGGRGCPEDGDMQLCGDMAGGLTVRRFGVYTASRDTEWGHDAFAQGMLGINKGR